MVGTMVVISAVPGPSDLAVVARSLSSGLAHALVMIAGILFADVIFILVAVIGLTFVADSMESLFVILKLLGAAFLIWMGISALLATRSFKEVDEPTGATDPTWKSSFLVGLLITLGDPKAILFYFGLLPAYLDPSAASFLDILAIILAATVAIVGVKLAYALLADRARRLFERSPSRTWVTTTAGVTLIGTGVFLIGQWWIEK